jgi:hypothetical protein
MVMTIIIIALVAILFVVWFMYGPGFFEPHDDDARANVISPEDKGISTPPEPPAVQIAIQ